MKSLFFLLFFSLGVFASEFSSSADLHRPTDDEIQEVIVSLRQENYNKAYSAIPDNMHYPCSSKESVTTEPHYIKNDYYVLVTVTTQFSYLRYWQGGCF